MVNDLIYDLVVIGRGPAGVSCAVYTTRANLRTMIVGKTDSSLLKAEKIENYYGFETPVSGKTLLESGEKQALRLGSEIATDEVVGIEKADHFLIRCVNGEYEAQTVLLAPGAPALKAPIKGIEEFEGRGVSYCTTCDGFFYRNKTVGVLGYTDYAIHEAEELLPFTKDITLYTNGKELEVSEGYKDKLSAFKTNTKKIKALAGAENLESIMFDDGITDHVNGLFVAYGSASGASFALKMGIVMNGKSIAVNDRMETNIEGLYAAGDCTGVFKQISVAVGQGAIASKGIIEYVRKRKAGQE